MDNNRIVTKVSSVSIIVNIVLSIVKLFAGIFAHSAAMISDAVHSASDVFSTIIVIIGFRVSRKAPDKEHPYGHERFECVAGIILSVILFVTGLGVAKSSFDSIITGKYTAAIIPGTAALVTAVFSILSKEALYRYTIIYAQKIDSPALKADAWHHRSDALSSIGALIGIIGARCGITICEPAACLVICLFIVKAAYDIFKEALDKMVDKACDDESEQKMRDIILAENGVENLIELKTRMFAARIYVDVVISADGALPLTKAHEIAENVHDSIEKNFPRVKHCMVHVDPIIGDKESE